MQEDDQEVTISRGFSDEDRRVPSEFLQSINEHVSAINDAAQAFLRRKPKARTSAPKEVRVVITASSDTETVALREAPAPGTYCYDESYICGKGQSGYIHCHTTVCIEVEHVPD